MKRIWVVLPALIIGCSGDDPLVDEGVGRGSVVSSVLIESVSVEEIEAYGLPVTPRSAVDLFRLRYSTVDARNGPAEASALLAVPKSRAGRLAIASYQHGTVVQKDDVASIQGTAKPEALVAVIFASTGYLGLMPDYLGLGEGRGLHPFVHAATLATAVADALRAARNYARTNDIHLEEEVYLLGYSEGGYATAATQRYLEDVLPDEFKIGGSAPMAAPFDLSGTMVNLLASDEPYPSPFFLPYTLLAYNSVYDLASSPSGFLAPPYDQTIPPLFDGTRSGGEIDRSLPPVPKAMLPDSFVAGVESDGSFPWRLRLIENTLLSWKPVSRTRIYHCEQDELIPVENSRRALEAFRMQGAPTSAVDLVTGDFGGHAECAPTFILLAKFWIDGLRTGVVSSITPEEASSDIRLSRWRSISEPVP